MSNTVEYDILVEVLGAVKDLKKLQTQTKKTKEKFDDTKKSGVEFAGQVGAAFTGIKGAADSVIGAVQKVAGAFLDAAVASFELSRSVVDNINDLNDLSARSSISAQNIEALKLAFVASGQSADSAKTILSQFPRVLTQIQTNGSKASNVMDKLGVAVRDKATGAFRSGNEVFAESIRKIQGIQDQTLKAQTATALFGRSAGDLLQALAAGEFDEFTDSIERYGTKAGPEASKQAAEFQKRLALLGVLADRSKQAFVQNTGALDFFIQALRTTQQALAGLNAFLQVGQKGVRALAKDVFNFTVRSFAALGSVVLDLIGGPLLNLIRTIDTLQQQITGVSLFEAAIQEIKEFTVQQYNLTEALNAGLAAFKAEGEIINQSTQATANNAQQNMLAEHQIKGLTKALTEKDTASKKDSDSTKDAAKAERERAKAIAQTIARIAKLGKERFAASQKAFSIQQSANEDLLSDLDKINQREKERLEQLKQITQQQKISTEEAQKAVKARAQRERTALSEAQSAAQIGGVGGQVASAIGAVSDPSALVSAIGSAFGPVGMAISESINALAVLGEKSPEEIQQEFEAFFEAVVKGIGILIPLLVEILPPIVFKAAGMISLALLKLPFQMVSFIAKGLVEAFKFIGGIFTDPMKFFTGISDAIGASLEGVGDAIGEAIAFLFRPVTQVINSIAEFFGGGTQSFMSGGRFLSAQGGLRFTGREQGLALLHSGETVVPRSGQMSSTVARDMQAQTGGGGVTININSAVTERSAIDSLVRKIEDRFGSFGQSTSPLFGGQ